METPCTVPPPAKDIDRIHVGVRVRPLNDRELSGGSTCVWRCDVDNKTIQHTTIPNTSTSVDYLYNETSDNQHIYNTIARPLVHSTLNGINGTLFAYGQTSSGVCRECDTMQTMTVYDSNKTVLIADIIGKTYTMSGVTRLAIDDIFARPVDSTRTYTYTVSYIEIYNEKIKDLLNAKNNNMSVHEDVYKGIFIGGLTEIDVTSAADVLQLLQRGDENRHIGSTAMNEHSSRSHSIFRLHISSKPVDTTTSTGVLSATLQLIDLAGSERQQHTQASGQRLKEGASINKSLLTLTTVIRKLSEAKGKENAHVNYRDSKLTRILQPALGGNSRTAIMCCITVSSQHIDETMSTLRFAARAKTVTNKIKVNEVVDEQTTIKQLKKELAALRKQLRTNDSVDGTDTAVGIKRQRLTISDHTRRESSMSSSSEIYDIEVQTLQDRCNMYEQTVEELNERIKELESAVDIVQLIEQRKLVEMERDDLKVQLYEVQQTLHSIADANNTAHTEQHTTAQSEISELQQKVADAVSTSEQLQLQIEALNTKYSALRDLHMHDCAAAEVEIQAAREQHAAELERCEAEKQVAVENAIKSSQREVKQIEVMITSIEQLMQDRLQTADADKQQLQERVNELTQQLHQYAQLQSQYDELIVKSGEYSQQLHTMQQQHTDAVQQLCDARAEVEVEQACKQQLQQQVQQLHHTLQQVQTQYNASCAELNDAKHHIAELTESNHSLCAQLDEMEDGVIQFNSVNTSRASISSHHINNDMQLATPLNDVVEQLESANLILQHHTAALQLRVDTLTAAVAEKQMMVEMVLNDKYDMQCKVEATFELFDNQRYHAAHSTKLHQSALTHLQQQYAALQADTTASQVTIQTLEQQLAQAQQALQNTEQQMQTMQSNAEATINQVSHQLQALQQQHSHHLMALNQQIDTLQQDALNMHSLHTSSTDEHIAALTQQLHTATARLHELQQQLESELTLHADSKQTIVQLNSALADKSEQLTMAHQQLAQATDRISELAHTIDTLHSTVAEHVQAVESLQTQANHSRTQQDAESNDAVVQLQQQLHASQSEVQTLTAQLESAHSTLQQQAAAAADTIHSVQHSNAELSEQLVAAQQALHTAQQHCADLQSQITSLTAANHCLQAETSALADKVAQLTDQTQRHSAEIQQAAQVRTQSEVLQQHNTELLQQIAAMNEKVAQIGEMTTALRTVQQQYATVAQQYTDLQHQYSALKDSHTTAASAAHAELSELKAELDKYKRRSDLYSNKYTEIRSSVKVQSDQLQQYKIQLNVLEQSVADKAKQYEERIDALKQTLDERDSTIRELEKQRPSEKMLMKLVKATRDVQKAQAATLDNVQKPAVNPIVPTVSIKPLQPISANIPILSKPIVLNKPILSAVLPVKPAATIVDKENHSA